MGNPLNSQTHCVVQGLDGQDTSTVAVGSILSVQDQDDNTHAGSVKNQVDYLDYVELNTKWC